MAAYWERPGWDLDLQPPIQPLIAHITLGHMEGRDTHGAKGQRQGLEDVQHGLQHRPAPEQVGKPAQRATSQGPGAKSPRNPRSLKSCFSGRRRSGGLRSWVPTPQTPASPTPQGQTWPLVTCSQPDAHYIGYTLARTHSPLPLSGPRF